MAPSTVQWLDAIEEEKCANVFPVLENIFKQKNKLMDEQQHISIYEMHDGKMLSSLNKISVDITKDLNDDGQGSVNLWHLERNNTTDHDHEM
eukprot:scaffold122320_cov63-Attheya_sp.AAC.1